MWDAVRSLLSLGGPVVAVLVVLSVFALALILLKLWQFWAERVGFHGRARAAVEVWRQGRPAEAARMMEARRSALEDALATAMVLTTRRLDKSLIEDEIQRRATDRLHELQKGFRELEAIAQIAPLIGLFGTVIGMIEAFRQLQAAGSAVDPSVLAGGIWVALLTTAAGLAVAIPVSLVLTWFETRLENERVAIETMAGTLLAQVAMSSEASGATRDGAGQEGAASLAHAH
ncbi:MotA/TolQ/ExbB proton channel family protein [Chelativorans sp. M5D2P16]|uniref:MotA/TolQ/ExbB proton channel family protein n=1 Tax=Chelativorans sp. M5D2P16 TaxID=3095678 RepID=UPI002AC9FB29|nr:MotA/TolQ/ExbB proton channel family protein [Chelativorans sp. M5D2P16]MDZ5698226.1 MotA/TolQ/ExbB proton channel family protein [Chelativorans sp. M5D2P16]